MLSASQGTLRLRFRERALLSARLLIHYPEGDHPAARVQPGLAGDLDFSNVEGYHFRQPFSEGSLNEYKSMSRPDSAKVVSLRSKPADISELL